MNPLENLIERKFANLQTGAAVVLPGGRRLGAADAAVTLTLKELSPLAHLAAGQVGLLAGDYVEGRLDISGTMRDVMTVAAQMIPSDPTFGTASSWWRTLLSNAKSVGHHSADVDARQVQFHYDVSDDLRAVARPAARVLLRLLPRGRHAAGTGAGIQARPRVPQADAARGRTLS